MIYRISRGLTYIGPYGLCTARPIRRPTQVLAKTKSMAQNPNLKELEEKVQVLKNKKLTNDEMATLQLKFQSCINELPKMNRTDIKTFIDIVKIKFKQFIPLKTVRSVGKMLESRIIQLQKQMLFQERLDLLSQILEKYKTLQCIEQLLRFQGFLQIEPQKVEKLIKMVISHKQNMAESTIQPLNNFINQYKKLPQTFEILELLLELDEENCSPHFKHQEAKLRLFQKLNGKQKTASQQITILKAFIHVRDIEANEQIHNKIDIICQHFDRQESVQLIQLEKLINLVASSGKQYKLTWKQIQILMKKLREISLSTGVTTISFYTLLQLAKQLSKEQKHKINPIVEEIIRGCMKFPRHILRPLQYLVSEGYDRGKIIDIVNEIMRSTEMVDIETIRIVGMCHLLSIPTKELLQDRFNYLLQFQPHMILQSLTRSHTKEMSRDIVENILMKHMAMLKTGQEKRLRFETVIISCYSEADRQFWWNKIGLMELIRQKDFMKDLVNLLSSRFLKLKKGHAVLIIDIYRQTNKKLELKSFISTWFLKMLKFNNFVRVFCSLQKSITYPFFRQLLSDPLMYRPPERAHRLLKIVQSMRKNSPIDPDFNNFVALVFTNYLSKNAFDTVTAKYFLRDLNVLLQKKLITTEVALKMEQAARQVPDGLIKRLQLLNFLDRVDQRHEDLWKMLIQDIKKSNQRHLKHILQLQTINTSFTNTQIYDMLSQEIPETGTQALVKQYVSNSKSPGEIAKLTTILGAVPVDIGIQMSHAFLKLRKFSRDVEATAFCSLLAQSGILIKQIMDMMCVQSQSIELIAACYKLGYIDDVFSTFLHRIKPRFKNHLQPLSPKQQYKTAIYAMGLIVCQKQPTTFNQQFLQQCISIVGKLSEQSWFYVDARLAIITDIIGRKYKELSLEHEVLMNILNSRERVSITTTYNNSTSSYEGKNKRLRRFSKTLKEQIVVLKNEEDAQMMLPKQYRLAYPEHKYNGDFALLREFIECNLEKQVQIVEI